MKKHVSNSNVIKHGTAAVIATILGSVAHGETFTVARECSGCSTLEQLESAAWDNVGSYVPTHSEALLLIVSDTYPISGYFKLGYYWNYEEYYGWFQVPVMEARTVDYASAIALDNILFSRASKVAPVAIPPDIASTVGDAAAPELVITVIQQTLVPFGLPHFGIWHYITAAGTALYWDVRDKRTGADHEIFVGDTITVTFQDGSSIKVKFLSGAPQDIRWQIVEGSARGADGQPLSGATTYTPVTPVNPGATAQGFGSAPTLSVTPIQWCEIKVGPECGNYIEWPNTVVLYCGAERTFQAPC